MCEDVADGKQCYSVICAQDAPDQVVGFVNFFAIIRGAFEAAYLGNAITSESESQGIISAALRCGIANSLTWLNLPRIMAK